MRDSFPINTAYPNIPELLRKYRLKPDKSLGQNFLIDPTALQKVVEAAEIQVNDTVLEIGPGLGSLTYLLAAQAKHIIAVELDGRLIPALQEVTDPLGNVEIFQADILQLNLREILEQPGYLVVANIPYYITSNLIRHLLETQIAPRRMVLTVQEEVAQRICATPGNMSLLALSVQLYGNPQLITRIPAGAFYPAPKVDSAVVRIDLFSNPVVTDELLKPLFLLAKAGFSQKRKTLRNALSAGMHWSSEKTREILILAGIDPQRRSETLSIQDWSNLAEKTHQLPPEEQ